MRPVVQSLGKERVGHSQNYTGAGEREGGKERSICTVREEGRKAGKEGREGL